MTITAALAADLRLLSAALDEPGGAVSTYLGLSVILSRSDRLFTFTYLTDGIAEGATSARRCD